MGKQLMRNVLGTVQQTTVVVRGQYIVSGCSRVQVRIIFFMSMSTKFGNQPHCLTSKVSDLQVQLHSQEYSYRHNVQKP